MIEQQRFEDLYKRCEGVFKTTVLIQKRLRELNRGARKLVDDDSKSAVEIVMKEIREGRIELIPDTEENRDVIRAEVERMTTGTVAAEVTEHTTEDELERRILSALGKVE
jgi:DNA-directed RNA polymerase subunit K/omega